MNSNKVAQRVAKKSEDFHDQLHAMDYQVYAYLQLGQDSKAKAVLDEMPMVTGFTETFLVGPYALAISPARYAIERADWKAAASLGVRPSPLAQVQAITYFARAFGAARSGNPEAAKADVAKLGELRDKLREAKDVYWSEQVDIQQKVASAWVLYVEGKYDDALNAMSAAADAEDKTEKHPVTPGVPKPGTRALWRDAARARNAQGSAGRFRSDAEEGAQSSCRLCGCGKGRRKIRRFSKSSRVLWQGGRDRQQCGHDARRDRRCARVLKVEPSR